MNSTESPTSNQQATPAYLTGKPQIETTMYVGFDTEPPTIEANPKSDDILCVRWGDHEHSARIVFFDHTAFRAFAAQLASYAENLPENR